MYEHYGCQDIKKGKGISHKAENINLIFLYLSYLYK